MKQFFKAISIILLLASSSVVVLAQSQSTDQSWELVKKTAKKENKLIFVDLYFKGCAPCAQMEKEVFPDPKIISLLEKNFVTFKSDVMQEEIGRILGMKYAITGFPTFLLMNTDGRIIDIVSGYHNVEQFETLLQGAKKNAEMGLFKKYSVENLEYPDFYRQFYLENKRNVSFEVIDEYLKKQPSLLTEVPFVIITGTRVGRQYDDFFLDNSKELAANYGKSSVRNHLVTILLRKKKIFEKEKDLTSFKKLLSEVSPLFSNEEWLKYEPVLLKDFAVATTVNQF